MAVGARLWYRPDPHTVSAAHCRFEKAVGAKVWNAVLLQAVYGRQTLFDVAVRAAAWYIVPDTQVVADWQARLVVGVGATTWNCDCGLHVTSVEHCASVVSVAAAL